MEFDCNYLLIIRREFINKSDFAERVAIPNIERVYARYIGLLDGDKKTLAILKLVLELFIHNKILFNKIKIMRSKLNVFKDYASVSLYNVIGNKFWLKKFIMRLILFFDVQAIIIDSILTVYTKFLLSKLNLEGFLIFEKTEIGDLDYDNSNLLVSQFKLYRGVKNEAIESVKEEKQKNVEGGSKELERRIVIDPFLYKQEEKRPVLSIQAEGDSSRFKLNFYFLSMRPFFREKPIRVLRHFVVVFLFNKINCISLVNRASLNILLFNALKLDWIGVDEPILQKVKLKKCVI